MKNQLISALLLWTCLGWNLAASAVPIRVSICKVTDPTGTALNVRQTPNGAVIGIVKNGRRVNVVGSGKDAQGRPWSKIRGQSGAVGWVLREFVSCY
jgi:cytochrome c oxidase assembly protein Cox11